MKVASKLIQTQLLPLERLGRALRQRRKVLNLSTVVVAEATDLSRTTVFRIERGEPSVSMGAYQLVADALGVELIARVRAEPTAKSRQGFEGAALNERARKSIAQKQATGADESSVLEESAEVDEPAKPVAKRRESTNNDFEQSSGFREDLRPPTQKWGRKDCSRIALGHLDGKLAETVQDEAIPVRIALEDFPVLQSLAWQIKSNAVVTPQEALDIYKANARHIDEDTLSPDERRLIANLRLALGEHPCV